VLLTIRHRTSYRYARPVWLQPHRMMLCPRGQHDLRLLETINTAIAPSLAYRVREEEGTQSPDETLDRGSGSCRDFAMLYIGAVRYLGFGAPAGAFDAFAL